MSTKSLKESLTKNIQRWIKFQFKIILKNFESNLKIIQFKKRVLHKDSDKKSFDPVRERIARRAALEFKNGMYGTYFKLFDFSF